MRGETDRLNFMIRRDGDVKAREFAIRTLRIYRACVLMNGRNGRKFHHASLPQFRRSFIDSYLCLKHFALGDVACAQ